MKLPEGKNFTDLSGEEDGDNVINLDHNRYRKLEKEWGKIFQYGVPAYNKHNHCTEVRFKIHQLWKDMAAGIFTKLNDGFWQSQSAFHRCIFALGVKCALEFLRDSKPDEVEKLLVVLDGLNKLARIDRLKDFKNEIRKLEDNLRQKDIYDDKAEKLFRDMRGKIDKMCEEI